ncbi:GTP-binding protein [Sabulibacter ruber]|uniref:GTP-binding protein n=1 Tax=Sabulibacter ruber TaxID=2811901 RepID=UPI001A973C8D|nr:GTP-binding protein [Sabulibacter ruber]
MKLYLVGGFLGSGKTTAIQKACSELLSNGIKVGVITNDQGDQLVDSGFMKGANVPTLEVTNGCFCCNYDQLDSNLYSLKEENSAEIIFAESVGSCTDLIATIVKPLSQYRPEIEVVVSVFADARVLPTLLQSSRLFADSVSYIYKKQLEEADLLVINKVDLLSPTQLQELKQLVEKKYQHKQILYQNSLDSKSIQNWLRGLLEFELTSKRTSLDIDYEVYGAGEALLAWVDQEIEIFSTESNAVEIGIGLIYRIHAGIKENELSIGHLKFLINTGLAQEKISFTTASVAQTQISTALPETRHLSILINARVQAEPDFLEAIISDAIQETQELSGCTILEQKKNSFQPGFPTPTHRILE